MTRLRRLGASSVLTFVLALACGSEDEGSGAGTGGADQDGAGGTASGGAASGGAASGGAASGGRPDGDTTGGRDGGGAGGSSPVDLDDLGQPCEDGSCPAGLTPTQHCGIVGCDQTTFCSCEIRCEDDADVCPEGSVCATVSDGPGDVCVRS